ncbi:MAG: hypothetical protein M3P23_11390 [Actinomycetota bacterium]|nr:hypothetical protein [Actinomycetota bacterium]
MAAEPESLLLPRPTEPDDELESELLSELLSELELEPLCVVLVPLVDAVPVELAARATAAMPIVPPTLSAKSDPVATAKRRLPCSLLMSMDTPSAAWL